MYLVVSKWEPIPGHEQEFERVGTQMRAVLSAQPGAEVIEAFETDGKVVVVHGYRDEAAYNAIINDPNGPFQHAMAEMKLEDHARWLSSEKGTTRPHA
jgi:heme-degrading monooxygenase HmoA